MQFKFLHISFQLSLLLKKYEKIVWAEMILKF